MLVGIILALIVAILWSLGEVEYSKISKSEDSSNVYFYQYFTRAVIYLLVALIFNRYIFGTFVLKDFLCFLPIIMCDLTGSYILNKTVKNGELSSVSPIMAAYPVVDILLGIFLLGEQASPLKLILVFVIAISIIVLASDTEKTDYAPHPKLGILFAVIYMLLTAFSTYFEKDAYLSNLSVYDLYYYKGIIYFLASVFFLSSIFIQKKKFRKPDKTILKGTMITPIGNSFYSFALNYGDMMVVTPLSSIYSVITNITSRKVLKEKITKKESICIGLILVSTITLLIMGLM